MQRFDLRLHSPLDLAAGAARIAALLCAAGAMLGLVFWDGFVAKALAGAALLAFIAVLAAPQRFGPRVGAFFLSVTTFVCLLAPGGGITFDPERLGLLLLVAPLAIALSSPLFAESLARTLRP